MQIFVKVGVSTWRLPIRRLGRWLLLPRRISQCPAAPHAHAPLPPLPFSLPLHTDPDGQDHHARGRIGTLLGVKKWADGSTRCFFGGESAAARAPAPKSLTPLLSTPSPLPSPTRSRTSSPRFRTKRVSVWSFRRRGAPREAGALSPLCLRPRVRAAAPPCLFPCPISHPVRVRAPLRRIERGQGCPGAGRTARAGAPTAARGCDLARHTDDPVFLLTHSPSPSHLLQLPRHPPGPAAPDLCRQAARGRPHPGRLQHPKGVDAAPRPAPARRHHRTLPPDPSPQVQPGQADLPQVSW